MSTINSYVSDDANINFEASCSLCKKHRELNWCVLSLPAIDLETGEPNTLGIFGLCYECWYRLVQVIDNEIKNIKESKDEN